MQAAIYIPGSFAAQCLIGSQYATFGYSDLTAAEYIALSAPQYAALPVFGIDADANETAAEIYLPGTIAYEVST
ncbi:MAG TPA: hypothetical protein VG326_12205 [Tepidisphaeraceae bacterium]|jgi:hypothetical protein|nr:hypothetical protein [Tepidisphaeraceae bacterium]